MKTTKMEEKMKKNVTFCITGPLAMLRAEAVALVESKTNAKFVNSVSSNTDYLVSARMDTVKAKKAKAHGTAVISEAELMAFVKKGKFPEIRV